MFSGELHAVTVPLHARRITETKLAVALPTDFFPDAVTAIGNGLAPSPSHPVCS